MASERIWSRAAALSFSAKSLTFCNFWSVSARNCCRSLSLSSNFWRIPSSLKKDLLVRTNSLGGVTGPGGLAGIGMRVGMGCVIVGIGPETGTKDEVSPGKTRPLKATGFVTVGSVTVGLVTVGFGLLGRGCLNAIGEGDLSPGNGTLVARIGSFVGEGWRVGIGGLFDGKGLVLVAVGDGSRRVGLVLTATGDRWVGRGEYPLSW